MDAKIRTELVDDALLVFEHILSHREHPAAPGVLGEGFGMIAPLLHHKEFAFDLAGEAMHRLLTLPQNPDLEDDGDDETDVVGGVHLL